MRRAEPADAEDREVVGAPDLVELVADAREIDGGGGGGRRPARLEEIQRVVADDRDVLADDGLRAEYLRGLGE